MKQRTKVYKMVNQCQAVKVMAHATFLVEVLPKEDLTTISLMVRISD